MTRQNLINLKSGSIGASICMLLVCILLPVAANAQPLPPEGGARAPATFDFVTLDGGVATIPSFVIFPYASGASTPGALGFARSGTASSFVITNTSPVGTLSVAQNGVGVGLNGFNQQPTSTLHVAGGGGGDAFSNAQIFVEDRNGTPGYRALLRMSNNGPVALRFDTVGATPQLWRLDTAAGSFNINDTTNGNTNPFRVFQNSPQNALVISGAGVGIGTPAPTASLDIVGSPTNGLGFPTIRMADLNPGGTTYSLNNRFNGSFFLLDDNLGNIPFFVGNGAPHNLLNLDPTGGVGINTLGGLVGAMLDITVDGLVGSFNPDPTDASIIRANASTMTVEKERTMLDLLNNGQLDQFVTYTGNSVNNPDPGTGTGNRQTFRVRTQADRYAIQDITGNVQANMGVFSDGAVRYSVAVGGANASPNITVKPNGDFIIIGQPAGKLPAPDNNAGGNLIVQGHGPGGGNLTVNRNGTVRGALTVNGRINGVVVGSSDRNLKENINDVDPEEVLAKVVDMPIATWNYKKDKQQTPHMGPMAQDFYKAFKLGANNKTIFDIDKSGVALAAIQGLHKQVQVKDEKLAEQSEMIEELTARLERLEAMVAPTNR